MESVERSGKDLSSQDSGNDAWNLIRESLQKIQYGSINISIQDSIVVQIDCTSKRRMQSPPAKSK